MESRSEVSTRKQDNAPRRSLNQWLLWVREKCFHMFTMSNSETCASQPPRAPSKTEPSWPSAKHYSLLPFSVSLTPWWVLHWITCQTKSLHWDACLWVCFWGPQLKTDIVGCPVIQESVGYQLDISISSPSILGIYLMPRQVVLLVGLGTLFSKQFWTHTLISLASLDLLLQILN